MGGRMNLQFSIESWSAWSNSMSKPQDWISWANNKALISENHPIDLSSVPAMSRRRMSSLSKMAFSTASECVSEHSPNCIFASQHGEMKRTMKILNAIVAKEDVSPTDFSLSVHSTALGLYSLLSKNKQPSTMVVGGRDTFGQALLEAYIYLKRFPDVPVLLVFFDEPLPEPLHNMETCPSGAFSIAFLLSTEGQGNFSMSYEHNESGNEDGSNVGLEFLKFYLSDRTEGACRTKRMVWYWRRK